MILRRLPFQLRKLSVLGIVALILSLCSIYNPPNAKAYSCGSSGDPSSECYAAATWGGNIDGASVHIGIVPLYSADGVLANQMWLKDTQSSGCTSYPYCWFEGGYTYAPYNGHSYYYYAAWINPAGSPTIDVLGDVPSGQTGDIYLAFTKSDPNDFNVGLYAPGVSWSFPVHVAYGMSPNFIQVGMRLSGSSGATADPAYFSNNSYYFGGNWYAQTNPGNPASGFVSTPPYGAWYQTPSTGQPGGVWLTSTNPLLLATPVYTPNYIQIWGST